MKKILFTILVAMAPDAAIFAQTPQWAHSITNPEQPDQCTMFATNAGNRIALLGLATPGSNIALIDNVTEANSTTLNFVAVYNDQAELLWSAPTVGIPFTIAINEENEVYVVGRLSGSADFDPTSGVQNVDLGVGGVYVQKLDSNGNLVWVGTTPIDGYTPVICETDDGRVFISGDYQAPFTVTLADGTSLNLNRGAHIQEFSTSGQLVGCYSLDIPVTSDYINVKDIATHGNKLIISGNLDGVCDFDPSANIQNNLETQEYDGFVAVFDISTGCDLQWKKMFRGNSWETASSVTMDESDNVYVSGGYTYTTDFDYEDAPGTWTLYSDDNTGLESAFMLKFDPTGTIQWAKRVCADNNTLNVGSVNMRALELKENGGLVGLITGYGLLYLDGTFTSTPVNLGAVNGAGYIVAEFDESGSFESHIKVDTTAAGIGSAGGVFPTTLKLLSQNRFLVGGRFMQYINFGSEQNPIVLSNDTSSPNFGFDSDIFMACYVSSEGLDVSEIAPNFTPRFVNPLQDEFLILERVHDIEDIQVFDMQGRMVTRSNRVPIPVEHLPAGVYSIAIELSDGTRWVAKAIK
jgi:hypothetical protein